MGMEVLIHLLNDNNNGKLLEINSELSFDSYLSPIALMLAYFASTLSLINRSQYELRSNTIRMNLVPKPYDIYANSQHLKEKHEEILTYTESSMLEQFFYMVFDITSFIYKNSYILLNIIMMVNSFLFGLVKICYFIYLIKSVKQTANFQLSLKKQTLNLSLTLAQCYIIFIYISCSLDLAKCHAHTNAQSCGAYSFSDRI